MARTELGDALFVLGIFDGLCAIDARGLGLRIRWFRRAALGLELDPYARLLTVDDDRLGVLEALGFDHDFARRAGRDREVLVAVLQLFTGFPDFELVDERLGEDRDIECVSLRRERGRAV